MAHPCFEENRILITADLLGGAAGVLNGSTLGLMDFFRRMGIVGNTPEDQRFLCAYDMLREAAPIGFQVGSQIGSLIPTIATGGLAKAPMMAIRNPLVRDAALGAVTNSVPVLLSETFQGEPIEQILLDTGEAALFGGALGALTRMMLDAPYVYGKSPKVGGLPEEYIGRIDNEVYRR